MNFLQKLSIYLLIIFSLNSCITLKDLKYLQEDENLVLNQDGLIKENIEPYRLRIDDVVKIYIETSDPDANLLFGPNNIQQNGSSTTNSSNNNSGGGFYMNGLQIQYDGYINAYGLGQIQASGNTLDQLKKAIQQKLDKLYQPGKAIARVYLEGINFTIMGEVQQPGNKTVQKYRLNLIEALAQSGDFTQLADRTNIHLIRQYPEGQKRVTLDITKENVMNSPYFYLHPNDIIIVDPRKEKVTGIGGGTTLGDVTQVLSITVQAITMYLFFKSL